MSLMTAVRRPGLSSGEHQSFLPYLHQGRRARQPGLPSGEYQLHQGRCARQPGLSSDENDLDLLHPRQGRFLKPVSQQHREVREGLRKKARAKLQNSVRSKALSNIMKQTFEHGDMMNQVRQAGKEHRKLVASRAVEEPEPSAPIMPGRIFSAYGNTTGFSYSSKSVSESTNLSSSMFSRPYAAGTTVRNIVSTGLKQYR
ncbi:hypothetical protein DRE_01519 [Drechslerella stenobrocha 248]|uniref:Uncharacterized protein n=1 Tax=Drechslerella stenobrocha 248 TaxID=1043628 RepID=W7HU83_9PEZI|nr:hypothetical protein DRE_01519 [Drechslerella stenobrocha 248]